MDELETFAAERSGRAGFCAVCCLPADIRVLIDKARRAYERAGAGSYKRRGHISYADMMAFLDQKGHAMRSTQALQRHFSDGHHRNG